MNVCDPQPGPGTNPYKAAAPRRFSRARILVALAFLGILSYGGAGLLFPAMGLAAAGGGGATANRFNQYYNSMGSVATVGAGGADPASADAAFELSRIKAVLDATRHEMELQKERLEMDRELNEIAAENERLAMAEQLHALKLAGEGQAAKVRAAEAAQAADVAQVAAAATAARKAAAAAPPPAPKHAVVAALEEKIATLERSAADATAATYHAPALPGSAAAQTARAAALDRSAAAAVYGSSHVPWGFSGPEVVLWLKADDGAIVKPGTNGEIMAWNDQSAASGSQVQYNFLPTHGGPVDAPTLVRNAKNSLPAVDFPCSMTNRALRLRDEMTFFAVLHPRKLAASASEGERFFGTYPKGQFRFHGGQLAFFGLEKLSLPDHHATAHEVKPENWFLAKVRQSNFHFFFSLLIVSIRTVLNYTLIHESHLTEQVPL